MRPLDVQFIVATAAADTDLDAACRLIQDALGQIDGGIAGLFFSGHDVRFWATLGNERRHRLLTDYVEFERANA